MATNSGIPKLSPAEARALVVHQRVVLLHTALERGGGMNYAKAKSTYGQAAVDELLRLQWAVRDTEPDLLVPLSIPSGGGPGIFAEMLSEVPAATHFDLFPARLLPAGRRPAAESANNARDKWLYDLACRNLPWQTIKNRLGRRSGNWKGLDSIAGIRGAVKRYARRKNLSLPPDRKPGRLPR